MNEDQYNIYISFPCAILGTLFMLVLAIINIRKDWNNPNKESGDIFLWMVSPISGFFGGYLFSYVLPLVIIIGLPILIIKKLRNVE